MQIDIYNSFFIQVLLFVLISLVLIISAVSLFIKPAKRTIRASLVEASSGHIIDISQSETSIGRAKTCDIVISDISVSRFHAVLSNRASGWLIFDTNSTAGIIVNNKPIEKKSYLNDGDSIILGSSEYIFYSTAVTTRQHIVPKTQTSSDHKNEKNQKTSRNTTNSAKKQRSTRSNKSEWDFWKLPKIKNYTSADRAVCTVLSACL